LALFLMTTPPAVSAKLCCITKATPHACADQPIQAPAANRTLSRVRLLDHFTLQLFSHSDPLLYLTLTTLNPNYKSPTLNLSGWGLLRVSTLGSSLSHSVLHKIEVLDHIVSRGRSRQFAAVSCARRRLSARAGCRCCTGASVLSRIPFVTLRLSPRPGIRHLLLI
jgi:hypothetical protein